MTSTVLILLAIIGLGIAFIIHFKGNKSVLSYLVGIMSIMLFVVGFNGYKEIKKDANIYYPIAVQWLEARNANNPGATSQILEEATPSSTRDNSLNNFSVYCIYYSPDKSRAVVYVELPSSKDNLILVFNRTDKRLDEAHFISKEKKPEPNMQNKLDPAIFFY